MAETTTTSTRGPLKKSIGDISGLMGGSVEEIWGLYSSILGLGENKSPTCGDSSGREHGT